MQTCEEPLGAVITGADAEGAFCFLNQLIANSYVLLSIILNQKQKSDVTTIGSGNQTRREGNWVRPAVLHFGNWTGTCTFLSPKARWAPKCHVSLRRQKSITTSPFSRFQGHSRAGRGRASTSPDSRSQISPNSLPASSNQATALSSCSGVWAAQIWARSRACPCGTTG